MEKIKFEYYSANVYDTIPKGEVELYRYLESIKSPKDSIKKLLLEIQEAAKEGDLKKKDKLKSKLHYVTPTVKTNKQGRKIENVIAFNPIMVVEWDKIDFAEELKQWLFDNFKCTIAVFLSPSKKGVKAFIRIPTPTDLDDYKAYYYGICYTLSPTIGFDSANVNAVLPLYHCLDEDILIRPWNEVEEWTRRGGRKNSFKEVKAEDIEPLEEVTEEDIKEIYWRIDRVFEKIEEKQTAHRLLLGLSTFIGGLVGYGYISFEEASDYICTKVKESDYCRKNIRGYCRTVNEFLLKGMSSPIKLREDADK